MRTDETVAVAVVILSACFMQTVSGAFLRSATPTDEREVVTKKGAQEGAHLTELEQESQEGLASPEQKRQYKAKMYYDPLIADETTRLINEHTMHARHDLTSQGKILQAFRMWMYQRKTYDEKCGKNKLTSFCKGTENKFLDQCSHGLGKLIGKSRTKDKFRKGVGEYCPYMEDSKALCKGVISVVLSNFPQFGSESELESNSAWSPQLLDSEYTGLKSCKIIWSKYLPSKETMSEFIERMGTPPKA